MKITKSLGKIISAIDKSYSSDLPLIGLQTLNTEKTIQMEVAYHASEYTERPTGNTWRMFLNIVNQFIDVELRATAVKIKSVEVISQDEDYIFSMVAEKELDEEFDRIKMSNFIRKFQKQKRLHGCAMIKVLSDNDEYLEVADLSLMRFDASDLSGGRKYETHTIRLDELESKRGIWDEEGIDELLTYANKRGEDTVEILELEGVMRYSDVYGETEDDGDTYELYRCFIGRAGNSQFLLDAYELKEPMYRVYWRERRPAAGNSKGISIVEETKPEQIAINESVLNRQEAEAILSKVGVSTNKEDIPSIMDVENGFVVTIDKNKGEHFDPVTFDAPQVNFQNTIDAFFQNAQRKVSVFESNSGEEVKAGATYGGQVLQNANASSYFNYLRGVDADDIVDIIENVVVKRTMERINKEHVLNAAYSPQQLALIDEYVVNEKFNDWFLTKISEGTVPFPEESDKKLSELKERQMKKGSRRSMSIPAGIFTLDEFKKKTRVVIANEQDDVQERINALVTQMQMMSPEDPVRLQIQREILELSGVSPAQFFPQSAPGQPKSESKPSVEKQLEAVLPEGQK